MPNEYTIDLKNNLEFILNKDTGKWFIKEKGSKTPEGILDKREEHKILGIYMVMLNVTTSCNLRCAYCSGGKRKNIEKNMSPEIGKLILDKVQDHAQKEMNGREVHIEFFGGEPLKNFPLIKKLIEYSKEKNYNFTFGLQSNGILLNDEMREFLKDRAGYSISLDGCTEKQNSARFHSKEIYDKILRNAQSMDVRHVVSVITKKNIENLEDIMDGFYKDGFKAVQFLPMFSAGDALNNEQNLEISSNTLLEKMIKAFDKNISWLLEDKQFIVKNLGYVLRTFFLETLPTSCTLCDASNYVAIAFDTNGDMYPCDAWYGIDEFNLGNISEVSVDEALKSPKNFRTKQTLIKKRDDKYNWLRLHTDGCPLNAYMEKSNISAHSKYINYYEGLYDYVARKLPFLIENNLVKKILEFEI